MLFHNFITCQPVNLTHEKKFIPTYYKLSFNSPSRWTSLAVLQLLPGSQLKITIMYDNNKDNEDVKRGFLQNLENTPEIKFECQ